MPSHPAPSITTSDDPATIFGAEAIGTAILVLVGTSVAVSATLKLPIAGSPADTLSVALSFGLVLVALASTLGHISGCHLNPAITLGLAIIGRTPWKLVPVYVLAQFVGAIVASLLLLNMYGPNALFTAHLGATQPASGMNGVSVFITEATVTFILVLVVVSVTTDDRAPAALAPVAIGTALFAAIMVAGPLTGGAVNPARAIGPMIVSGQMKLWYVYLLAPIAGGMLGALCYDKFLRTGSSPK